MAVSSRGLESVVVAFPGFAQNANGAIHPRGAHNQMTFVVDDLPISDQLTGAFANALDVAVVQTAELLTSNIPAEFGGKAGALVNVAQLKLVRLEISFQADVRYPIRRRA